MLQKVCLLALSFTLNSMAQNCALDTPIDLGTNDPRAPITWNKRIVLSDVTLDPEPTFNPSSELDPPASDVIAVELYGVEGICGGEALGAAFGLTGDCDRASRDVQCDVDALEYERQGFSHRYGTSYGNCSARNTVENGLHTYLTSHTDFVNRTEKVKALVKDQKLLSLEITLRNGETYCVRKGRRAQPSVLN